MRRYTIEQARMLSGKTQVEMSNLLDMSETTYIKYEKYRMIFRMDTAYLFSTLTGIPLDEIIFFETKLQKNCIES